MILERIAVIDLIHKNYDVYFRAYNGKTKLIKKRNLSRWHKIMNEANLKY